MNEKGDVVLYHSLVERKIFWRIESLPALVARNDYTAESQIFDSSVELLDGVIHVQQ